ncbi:MAG: DUF120 domain-containing protein [Candidatus Aenigmarchaeota archaeon]|nr:DUF120 domain-containing protein [Candidatus Aenigmarchaeota archaeon]
MKIKGKIFSGFGRGGDLIKKWGPRITHLLKISPYPGTLNVRLQEPINIAPYATIEMDYILSHGKRHIDAYFMPVKLVFKDKTEECWGMRDADKTYNNDVLELLSTKNLKEVANLKDGDEVEIELPEKKRRKTKVPGFGIIQEFMERKTRAGA